MSKKLNKNLMVALDIGTSKITALVGEATNPHDMEVVGFASHPSRGLKRGVVVNIEATVASVQNAIKEAGLMAGCDIQSAYAGVAGNHIGSLNSHGIVAIRDREVTQGDVDRVIDAAKAVPISADQRILHILPQEFIIDGQGGIRDPIGMSGVRLETKVHIVTGAASAAQNITKCIRRCGLHVDDIILDQIASSYSVLTEDEKELGVCVVDMGGGTTDIAVFTGGAIRYTSVIPIAGNHVTNDIAVVFCTSTQHAEQVKIQNGSLPLEPVNVNEMIPVPGVSGCLSKQVPRKTLLRVMTSRYEEVYTLVLEELIRNGFKDSLAAGIVLTGGASKVSGAAELAESIFHMPVRIGVPDNMTGLTDVCEDPAFATGVGLLLHGRKGRESTAIGSGSRQNSLWPRMKTWFVNNF